MWHSTAVLFLSRGPDCQLVKDLRPSCKSRAAETVNPGNQELAAVPKCCVLALSTTVAVRPECGQYN